ncbi:hypothetical protein SAMN05421876_101483 [Kaistella jeonii]|nr:hypothetical protein SAMN05421876_101483 [Kaistella jeonii]VEI95069.1 Uncharacterised protein [Kaistella jeonii]
MVRYVAICDIKKTAVLKAVFTVNFFRNSSKCMVV